MKRLYFTCCLLIALITQSSAITLSERIDSLMQMRYGSNEPGAAVMIIKGDDVLFEGYYGIADMDKKLPITDTTTFNIASISKQFTVVGALALQQQGKLDINSVVGRYYPEFTADFWKDVTIKHLASQSSGIPDSRDRSSREAMIYANDSVSMSYFPSVTNLKFAPGNCYDYVNPTFLLIADIIEKISGEKFVEYQQHCIFDCCAMNNTYYFDPMVSPKCQSHGYVVDTNGMWHEKDYGEETFFATRPDGGIYSTVKDLAKWERGLATNKILSQSLLQLAYTPVVSVTESTWCDYQRRPNTYYALGWFVDKTPGFPVKVYHTGDNGGYQAYLAKYPAHDIAIIVLENRNDKDRWSMAKCIDGILKEEGLFLLGSE